MSTEKKKSSLTSRMKKSAEGIASGFNEGCKNMAKGMDDSKQAVVSGVESLAGTVGKKKKKSVTIDEKRNATERDSLLHKTVQIHEEVDFSKEISAVSDTNVAKEQSTEEATTGTPANSSSKIPFPPPKAMSYSLLAVLFSIAAYQFGTRQEDIFANQIPIQLVFVWLIMALLIGGELGRMGTEKKEEEEEEQPPPEPKRAPLVSVKSDLTMDTGTCPTTNANNRSSTSHYTMFNHMKFPTVDNFNIKKYSPISKTGVTGVISMDGMNEVMPWTILGRRKKGDTRTSMLTSSTLVSRGMTDALSSLVPKDQKKSLKDLGVSQKELDKAKAEDVSLMGNTATEDPERLRAKTLEQDYVQPLCPLRGIDVFTTDMAEPDLAQHSYLIEHGLRDRPTFVLNLMTQWGNVAMYFEFPSWVEDWDTLPKESSNDTEDVIALKRWLHGNDEYRNKRLKVLAVLVDGPGPIKFVAPGKKTIQVVRPCLPGTWTKHPCKRDASGNITQHVCLELDGDLMFERGMRTGASLIKKYLYKIVGDCALLIEKPYKQKEEEPRACIGMARFDRVDVSSCPHMPPRMELGKTTEDRDLLMASVLAGRPIEVTS